MEANAASASGSDDLLALNEALNRLSEEEPSVGELLKLRNPGGLNKAKRGD